MSPSVVKEHINIVAFTMFIRLSRLSSRNDNGDMRVIRAEIQSIDGSLGKKPDIPRVPSALLLGTCCSTDLEPETPYGSGVQKRHPSRWHKSGDGETRKSGAMHRQ
jgi:hypothetical protein